MTADELIHNLDVRVFFGVALGGLCLVVLGSMHLYAGLGSPLLVYLVSVAALAVGVVIGPERVERFLELFKELFYIAGSGG